MGERFILSDKYLNFIEHAVPVEFLEGTTAAGKTTVGVFKYMLKVAESPKKLHILSGLDLGPSRRISLIRIWVYAMYLVP
jgi:hypothetical protein